MARITRARGIHSLVGSVPRRRFLQLAGAAAAVAVTRRPAAAETWPSQPIRFVVGFPPGGGADIVSRIMAAWLSQRLGQQVFVENKPGASTNLSLQTVANAPPDGHTIVFIAASAVVNVSLFAKQSADVRDITPVAGLVDFPLVLLSNPEFPPKTVAEVIAYAKANPGKVSIGSFGTGTTSHVSGELFKQLAGIDIVHVPYRGGAAMATDLIAGRVQIGIDVLTGELAHIQAGTIRAIAFAGKTRYPTLPDVPTIGETMPLYVANSWAGVGVPRGTPPEIVARLNREINAGLADPAVKARLTDVAATPLPLAPEEAAAYVRSEIDKWAGVIRTAGIKVE
jgi:tripartite-type tricarboxylate transporter receptor subunit TctC